MSGNEISSLKFLLMGYRDAQYYVHMLKNDLCQVKYSYANSYETIVQMAYVCVHAVLNEKFVVVYC